MSNLFELLAVSVEDKKFREWIKCFELLFDVRVDQIESDYNKLFKLVNVTTNTYDYDTGLAYGISSKTDQMVYEYDWTTVEPRNPFRQTKLF